MITPLTITCSDQNSIRPTKSGIRKKENEVVYFFYRPDLRIKRGRVSFRTGCQVSLLQECRGDIRMEDNKAI